jgi:hypothetical protein
MMTCPIQVQLLQVFSVLLNGMFEVKLKSNGDKASPFLSGHSELGMHRIVVCLSRLYCRLQFHTFKWTKLVSCSKYCGKLQGDHSCYLYLYSYSYRYRYWSYSYSYRYRYWYWYFDIDIFVNCNWVATRWQQYSTHLHTNNTQNNTINNFGWKAFWDSNPGWSN